MQPENEKERERKRVREGDGRHRRGMKTALVNGFLPDSFTRFSPFPSVSVVPLTHPPSLLPSFFSFSLTYFHFFPSSSSSLSPSFFLSSFPPLFFFPSSPTTVVFISAVRVPSPPLLPPRFFSLYKPASCFSSSFPSLFFSAEKLLAFNQPNQPTG